jgi:hypothetical protein
MSICSALHGSASIANRLESEACEGGKYKYIHLTTVFRQLGRIPKVKYCDGSSHNMRFAAIDSLFNVFAPRSIMVPDNIERLPLCSAIQQNGKGKR